jgi:hypothetical protein
MSLIAEEYVAYRFHRAPDTTTPDGDAELSDLTLYIRVQGNQFRYEASYITSPEGNDAAITGGTAQVTIDSTLQTIHNITPTAYFWNGSAAANVTGDLTTATSTVRFVVVVNRKTAYSGGAYGPLTTYTYDQTFTVKQPTSLTVPLLTAATVTRPWIVFLPSTNTLNYLHLKNTGNQEMHIRVKTRSIDGSTNSRRLPANAGMTLFQDGASSWFIGSYYGATLPTGISSVPTATTATSPIVLANINSTDKTVGLPNPATFQSSYLCVCGYGTGTSAPTGKLYVLTSNYSTEASGSSTWFRFDPESDGRSVGVLFVSDGSKWHVVGVYRGTGSVFDTTPTGYSSITSTIGLASAQTTNGVTPGITPVADSGVLQMFKTKVGTYSAKVVVGNGSLNAVNSNYRRWYQNTSDYAASIFINAKIGSGTVTVFPLAQYPSDN